MRGRICRVVRRYGARAIFAGILEGELCKFRLILGVGGEIRGGVGGG